MEIRNVAGGVPEPEELIGRDHLIAYVWEQLAGNNIYLIAPRRFGKTGVMHHLVKRHQADYLPVYLDVEDLHDPDGFVAALIASLLEQSELRALICGIRSFPKTVLSFFKEQIGRVKTDLFEVELREVVKDAWESVAKTLLVEMEKAEKTVLFTLDEFPQFIDNLARKHGDDPARRFLQWFRALRMSRKDVLRRNRFVIAGSTSLDIVLRRLDAPDKLNDFFRVPVEPISAEHADRLLDSLCARYGLRLSVRAGGRCGS